MCRAGLVGIVFVLFLSIAGASPSFLTYQGRILKSDGTPLEYASTQFRFSIKDATGKIIYEELSATVDLTGSNGIFDVSIGSGTVQYPIAADTTALYAGGFKLADAFNNSRSFYCKGQASATCYQPTSGEKRFLKVQFFDGNSWNTISPDMEIRSVPFAAYSSTSEKLGSYSPADFFLKNGMAACNANDFITYDGTNLSCATPAGGGGAVTGVNAPLAISSGTLSIPAATNAQNGYLTSTDWTTFNNKQSTALSSANIYVGNSSNVATARAVSGDLSVTDLGAFKVLKIQGQAVNSATPSSGHVLKFSTEWTPGYFNIADLKTSSGAQQFTGSACAANTTLVYTSITDTYACASVAISDSQVTNSVSRTANTFLAAPNGSNGAASYRTIASADISPVAFINGGQTDFGATAKLGNNTANGVLYLRANNQDSALLEGDGDFFVRGDMFADGGEFILRNSAGTFGMADFYTYFSSGGSSTQGSEDTAIGFSSKRNGAWKDLLYLNPYNGLAIFELDLFVSRTNRPYPAFFSNYNQAGDSSNQGTYVNINHYRGTYTSGGATLSMATYGGTDTAKTVVGGNNPIGTISFNTANSSGNNYEGAKAMGWTDASFDGNANKGVGFRIVGSSTAGTQFTIIDAKADGSTTFGNTNATYMSGTATVARFYNSGAQSCTVVPNNGGFACSSDGRLKRNIAAISGPEALGVIEKLNAKTYEWINGDGSRHTGYIAQEVEKILPEAVHEDEQTQYKQVGYFSFIPLITESIKEIWKSLKHQNAEVAIMKKEIAALKKQNQDLTDKQRTLTEYLCKQDRSAPFCQ
ncbi:tail fiber domain-containing protein [Bdellovibrio reynosensis]|uniref:Tail fiber domain-containing protein n=1 Tax=Bdellovibrio reynosensis TaxID=2835041 RepID=A0ABY4C7T2_9BACT|nr:tail fiber domain-containing protein [Bdellovibrio reynosensis]UOF01041.1 tail fiber domain-containing protein [Bdellovibrio reynosensis]